MTTPILNIPEVQSGQVNQYLVYNMALRALEASQNNVSTLNLASENVAVTLQAFVGNYMFVGSGHTVARTVTFPANKRQFAVRNAGSEDLTVKIGTAELVVPSSSAYLFYADGTANGLFRVE